jgi:outer membrane protein assembly factor BamB
MSMTVCAMKRSLTMKRFLVLCFSAVLSMHSAVRASYMHPVAFASPFLVLNDGTENARVALIRPDGVFLMLKLSDGSLLARHESPSRALMRITEFRLLDDDRIGVAAQNGYRIFDSRTGELLVTSMRRHPVFAGDFVFSASEYIVYGPDGKGAANTDYNVSATNWRTGETVWTVDLPREAGMVAYKDGRVIISYAQFPPPVIGQVYSSDSPAILGDYFFIAFDARTGEEQWRVTLKLGYSETVLLDDTLYAHFREYRPERAFLWRWNLEGKPLADNPIVVGPWQETPLYDWGYSRLKIPAGTSVNGHPPIPLDTPFGRFFQYGVNTSTVRAIQGDTVLSAYMGGGTGKPFAAVFLEYRDGERVVWSGRLPRIGRHYDMVYALALTNDLALVASDSAGKINAIDRKTGHPRWIFHFPIWREVAGRDHVLEDVMPTEEDLRRDPRAADFIGFRPDGVDAPPCPVHVFEPFTPRFAQIANRGESASPRRAIFAVGLLIAVTIGTRKRRATTQT